MVEMGLDSALAQVPQSCCYRVCSLCCCLLTSAHCFHQPSLSAGQHPSLQAVASHPHHGFSSQVTHQPSIIFLISHTHPLLSFMTAEYAVDDSCSASNSYCLCSVVSKSVATACQRCRLSVSLCVNEINSCLQLLSGPDASVDEIEIGPSSCAHPAKMRGIAESGY